MRGHVNMFVTSTNTRIHASHWFNVTLSFYILFYYHSLVKLLILAEKVFS